MRDRQLALALSGLGRGNGRLGSLRELLTQAIPPPLSIEPPILPSSASQLTSFKISKSDQAPTSPHAPKKDGFGSFLNRLLGERDFANYEEVPTVFYRLDNRREYGPATLDRALTFFRSNEGRGMYGRFADDKASDQCMRRFRQLAFESYLKTQGENRRSGMRAKGWNWN